jgi:hypothetical protein
VPNEEIAMVNHVYPIMSTTHEDMMQAMRIREEEVELGEGEATGRSESVVS